MIFFVINSPKALSWFLQHLAALIYLPKLRIISVLSPFTKQFNRVIFSNQVILYCKGTPLIEPCWSLHITHTHNPNKKCNNHYFSLLTMTEYIVKPLFCVPWYHWPSKFLFFFLICVCVSVSMCFYVYGRTKRWSILSCPLCLNTEFGWLTSNSTSVMKQQNLFLGYMNGLSSSYVNLNLLLRCQYLLSFDFCLDIQPTEFLYLAALLSKLTHVQSFNFYFKIPISLSSLEPP